MAYKAIIFDFFDVIHADPFQHWMKAHDLTREGPAGEASRELDLGYIKRDEFFRRLGLVTGQTQQGVTAELTSYAKLDYQMVDFIDGLRAQYKVALITNAESEFIRKLLADHDLERLFHHIVVSSEVGYAKPDPEIFEHTMQLLQSKLEETVFIDDNPKNIAAAEAQGITGIVFRDINKLRHDLAKLQIDTA